MYCLLLLKDAEKIVSVATVHTQQVENEGMRTTSADNVKQCDKPTGKKKNISEEESDISNLTDREIILATYGKKNLHFFKLINRQKK